MPTFDQAVEKAAKDHVTNNVLVDISKSDREVSFEEGARYGRALIMNEVQQAMQASMNLMIKKDDTIGELRKTIESLQETVEELLSMPVDDDAGDVE